MSDQKTTDDIVQRLRGHYRTPITDGLGPAGGEEPDNPNEHVRTFPTPPIQKEAADEIERLRSALSVETTKWRHKTRGTIYVEIGRGTMQDISDLDNEPVVIYRGDDGRLWVRTVDEFEDGRFERV